MGRKLPFLPTCGSPTRTLSFRATTSTTSTTSTTTVDMFTATAAAGEYDEPVAEPPIESVIRGLSSDRFFFEPGKTSSILEAGKAKESESSIGSGILPFKESVAMMEMESTDPFVDFKKSMQEMVEADEGLKDWENLQELLGWYLAVNGKSNHGYIVGAFVDLLIHLGPSSFSSASSSSSSSSSSMNGQDQSLLMDSSSNSINMIISSQSPVSALSFTSLSSSSCSGTCSSTSPCLSSCSLEDQEQGDDDHQDHSSTEKTVVPEVGSDDDSLDASSSSSNV